MTEIVFYHLERRPLDAVLPTLLEKSLERGWRAVVQCGSAERLESLDAHLWSYRDDAFLAHGTAADGDAGAQPIYLTTGEDNPNGADIRFLVDRAEPGDLTGYTRVVLLFDGRDDEAVAEARRHWKRAAADGHDVTYWRQDDHGRWVREG